MLDIRHVIEAILLFINGTWERLWTGCTTASATRYNGFREEGAHTQSKVDEWAASYERTYRQLRSTGILDIRKHERITIEPRVSGRIVVMGYSGVVAAPIPA